MTAIIDAAALAWPIPVVIWHTPVVVQRTPGKSFDKPGTRTSRWGFSAAIQGAASGLNMLMIMTFTTIGSSATLALAAPTPSRDSNTPPISLALPCFVMLDPLREYVRIVHNLCADMERLVSKIGARCRSQHT